MMKDEVVDEVTRQRQKDCGIKGGYKHPFIKSHGTEYCVNCGVSMTDWEKMMTEMAQQTTWGFTP